MNPRELFWVHISYDVPQGGPVPCYAESEENAREMLTNAYGSRVKNFTVHDVYKLSPEQRAEQERQMQFNFDEAQIDKEKMN